MDSKIKDVHIPIMDSKIKDIAVPTFVNPHLFWIIESNNDRKKTLKNLNKIIQDEYNNYKQGLNQCFEIGEIVAVLVDNNYCRAIIEDIPKTDAKNKSVPCFLCWLIDYGTMYETDTIYKLPSTLRKVPPLALQASLNNVSYVQQHLTYDKCGLPVKSNEPISTPTSTAHQVSLELMANLCDLKFVVEDKVDGILLGDILYKSNQELKSLRETLIRRGILIIEDVVFKEIQENIYSYKEEHLWLIAQVCKKLNSINFVKGVDHTSWCEKIISKYLEEFEDSELFDDCELTISHRTRKRRSRNTADDSQNSITSGNDSVSDIDSPNVPEASSSSKQKSTSKSRIKLLLEEMKKQKLNLEKPNRISSENLSSNSDSFSENNDSKNDTQEQLSGITPCMEKNRKAVFKEQINTYLDLGAEEAKKEDSIPRKIMPPKGVEFVPGGASYSLRKIKEIKKNHSQKNGNPIPKISSEEELSDCKTVNVIQKADKYESPTDDTSTTEESKINLDVERGHTNQLQIKPFCACKQCDHWTNDNDWQVETTFLNESKQLKQLTINKPLPLFVSGEDVVVNRKIISLNYSSKTKVQKQAMPKLLVHGEYSQAPVQQISEIYFHNVIHNNLHLLKYKVAKRIQMYAWPAILRQQHVFMISGPQTGKTMAYLPVILTFLLEKDERYEQFASKTGGPIAIILCSNTKKCEEIYDLSKALLRNKSKICLVTYPFSYINTKFIDMLITTPPILIDLLKMKTINFKRLCHLILEDGDNILKLESEIMHSIFDLTQNMLCNRLHPKPVQLIVCAEHWNFRMESLVQKLSKLPLICIGNHLEAALYGKVQFSMKFINSACKEHEMKNLLKETFRFCKSIILCRKEEIEDIQTILMLKGIDATVISEDMNKEDILYMEEVWTQCKGGEYTVLVCTDFVLNTLLTVTGASLLIHYSLPSSWTHFVKRFGCLLENCKSPFDTQQTKTKCQSVVLCDENSEAHMYKFFSFIDSTELKSQLPDKFKSFSEHLKKLEEKKKLDNNVGLCDSLKLFGTCSIVQCPWRHIVFKEEDVSDYLPQSGKIKFKIVNIHDVTNYSVQLLQHFDMENNVQEFTEDTTGTEELTNVIKISKKQVVKPLVGYQYAYYDMDEMEGDCHRCELLEIEGDYIKIKLVDKGSIIRTIRKRLFKLPKEFKIKPRKIIDIYLANLTPPYRDTNFSARSFLQLKALLEKHDYKDMVLTGDIYLQLGNTLWVKNVHEEVILPEKVIPRFQLTREILVLKLAEYSNSQLNNIYKLCKEASITLPTYEKPLKNVIKEERKIEPQWAHLDMNVNEVTFSAAISPDETYIRLNKFNQQLYSLQKEIQESLKKPNYPKLQKVEIGTVCLAKDPEGIDYARVIVKNVEDSKALCFFVDFGDEAVTDINELRYIHNKFITKLPFQSIQCRLHGIKPVLDEWQSDVNNILYEYATEPTTDVFRLLFVKVCNKEQNELNPKQNRYSVLLKDGFGEKHVLINSLLINCGVAVPNSEQIDDFDISMNSFTSDETDEEMEHIIDICRKTKEVEDNVCVNADQSNKEVNEDMELFLFDASEFFRSLMTVENDVRPGNKRELPAIQAAPPVDYCTPEVYWSQTDKFIKMDIKLHDVVEYSLNLIKGTIMNFKTVKNEKTYKLNFMLYQKVSSSFQHTSMGPHIRVTLTKKNQVEWPHLTFSKQRSRNIHYDISTIKTEEKTRKFLELPGMSDEDSDDNEIDVMYHVVSDIDSDMDADPAEDSD